MNETLWFAFDDLNIMSAYKLEDKDYGVDVVGNVYNSETNCTERAIFLFHEDMLHEAMHEWIEYKAGYCEEYGHLAGVGEVYITEFEEITDKEDEWLIPMFDEEIEEGGMGKARLFICYKYSIRMERGFELDV